MVFCTSKLLAALWFAFLVGQGAATPSRRWTNGQTVNLWKLEHLRNAHLRVHAGSDSSQTVLTTSSLEPEEDESRFPFQGHWFRQPVDHFNPDISKHYRQRYWINTRHYRPNTSAPVIVLDGGETSGFDRLPFLDTGIVEILAKATGGVGVVLEHRYYGNSRPVYNLTTDALRFLNNSQSLEDSANFMANVKFPGIDEDLTAPNTPWIYYGGSYAGARAAHMRVLYPDLVYGAIASSGVTHASLSNWEYMEIIREAADKRCSRNLEQSIKTIDHLLETPLRKPIKQLFGLGELEHDDDFMSLLSEPLGWWQSKVWDPKVGSTEFDVFCATLEKPILAHTEGLNSSFFYDNEVGLVSIPSSGLKIRPAVLNYAQYIKKHYVSQCPAELGVEACFGTYNDEKYQDTTIFDTWRLWLFQVCTEWGYFATAPLDPEHPRIVSKLLTLEYESKICRQAFPAGEFFTVPSQPNITAVNALGDFDIAADRLAIIDGEVDPWKPCTPHSSYAKDREDTILRPFKVIPNGVHHYDEYGLADIEDEPPEILKIHKEMIYFVQEWLKDWEGEKARRARRVP